MIENPKAWPLGVCVLPDGPPNRARTVNYSGYAWEILAHAGVCHTRVAANELHKQLPNIRLLLTVGHSDFSPELKKLLADWIHDGGAWVAVGGTCGMDDLLGVAQAPRGFSTFGGGATSLGEAYLVPKTADHPILRHVTRPLHFFEGASLKATDASVLATCLDKHQRDGVGNGGDRPVIFERHVGAGRCIVIAADVTGTVVRIQQGIAVTRDGVSAPDGTAPIADGVLKSGDGGQLDWSFDREAVPGSDGFSAFLQPIADQWREILLRSIFHVATTQPVALPLLWLYPRNLPALAHMSHDTDGNDAAKGKRLLEVVNAAQIHTTWCTIMPGYPADLVSAIREGGHELAMHYDSMTEGLPWSEALFEKQFRALTEMFGGASIVTNKNHYLRWEGDCELFDWCAKRGIELDQSKGASKTGEAGFNFGTCHPYLPVRRDGSTINVLELPTPTQDLFVFAPEAILEPLLAQAKKTHGVLHLLFHPAHFRHQQVADAMLMSIRRGREEGLEWWTGRQINAWERARRTAKMSEFTSEEFTI